MRQARARRARRYDPTTQQRTSSLVALILTLLAAFLTETLLAACTTPADVAALALHLPGGVLQVVSAATTACSVLKSQRTS